MVPLPLPDSTGRFHILSVHCRKCPVAEPRETILRVATETEGLCGAELANIVNEAALLAVRGGETHVGERHLLAAARRVRAAKVAGPAQQLQWLQQQLREPPRARGGAQPPVD